MARQTKAEISLFPGDARVRNTSEVYRDMALEVAES